LRIFSPNLVVIRRKPAKGVIKKGVKVTRNLNEGLPPFMADGPGDIVVRLSLPLAQVFGTQNDLICAVSSVGRASPRHGGGHRFKPCTAHQFKPCITGI
jgi:hypothetical protein